MYAIYLTIGIILSLYVYWKWLEPDPLEITATEDSKEWVTCSDRKFTFSRYVHNTKYITVYVEPRLKDLRTGVEYVLPGKVYAGPPQHNRVDYITYIPEAFESGEYEYIPTLTYDVNHLQTITKRAPTQKVILNCSKKV